MDSNVNEVNDADGVNQPKWSKFKEHEDIILCKAYINVSEDPVKGCDQKADQFEEAVSAKFHDIYRREYPREFRTWKTKSILTRWKIQIAPEVRKFNTVATQMPERSGESEADFHDRCMARFFVLHKHRFLREHCLPYLKNMPKVATRTCSPEEKNNSSINGDVYSHIETPRPIGKKCQKIPDFEYL